MRETQRGGKPVILRQAHQINDAEMDGLCAVYEDALWLAGCVFWPGQIFGGPLVQKIDVLVATCAALTRAAPDEARELVRQGYPHVEQMNAGRRYSEYQKVTVFMRDGFIDRYSGERLVFPGALRLLSIVLPEEFPFHPNWKTDVCHPMYWELYPTIDHIQPVSRGGRDDDSNWVCTSMLRNGAKANWTLDELGWELVPPGKVENWDGLMPWYLDYLDTYESQGADHPALRSWTAAARRCINEPVTAVRTS
jgi:hypothetical protein